MIIIINNACNRKCSYCFEGKKLNDPGMMSAKDVKEILEFSKSDEEEEYNVTHSIMGGEPTLNPQFGEILNITKKYSKVSPLVLTNGTGEPRTSHIMGSRDIRVSVHINILDPYTDIEINKIINNLSILKQYMKLSLSITLSSPTDNLDALFNIIRLSKIENNIRSVRIGISSPGYEFKNIFPRKFNIQWGKKYLDTFFKLKNLNDGIMINNECCVNMCMVDYNTYNILQREVGNFKNVCYGGNFDIFPDFSSHYCYACDSIPELRVDNIFDYKDAKHFVSDLKQKGEDFNKKLGVLDECRMCGLSVHNSTEGCVGPCIAYKYFIKNIHH